MSQPSEHPDSQASEAPAPQYQASQPLQQQPQQPPLPNPAYGCPQPKSKIAAGLLGICLGGLGIHRFYLGYTVLGIVQLHEPDHP